MEMPDQPPRRVGRASHQEVLNWWQRFRVSHKYPLYCLFFITDADKEAVSFINKHGDEISNISGDNCLILFFHQGSSTREFGEIDIPEYSITILDLARVLDVDDGDMPCAVFFDDIFSELRTFVSLKNKTSESILNMFREIFEVVQTEKYKDKLVLLWEHQLEQETASFMKRILRAAPSIIKGLSARFL